MQFVFGGGETRRSRRTVKFEVSIGGGKFWLQTEVIDGSCPLLISQSTMRRLGMTLNLASNHAQVQIPGRKTMDVKTFRGPSGHLLMGLSQWYDKIRQGYTSESGRG